MIRRVAALAIVGALVLGGALELQLRRALTLEEGAAPAIRDEFRLEPFTQFGVAPYEPAALAEHPYFGTVPWPPQPDIIMLGASTAAGAHASTYDRTYFRLASAALGHDIVTAGRPAFVSGQELNVLALQVAPQRPHAVILLSGFNDLYVPVAYGTPPGYPANWGLLSWLRDRPGRGAVVALAEHSAIARAWLHRQVRGVGAGRGAAEGEREVDVSRVFAIWERNVRAMAALCRGAGIRFVFVAQPNGAVVDAPFTPPFDRLSYPEFFRTHWPAFVEHARYVCTSAGVEFVDATEAVRPAAFVDAAHFRDSGHEDLSRMLVEVIQRWEAPRAVGAAADVQPVG